MNPGGELDEIASTLEGLIEYCEDKKARKLVRDAAKKIRDAADLEREA